MIARFFTRLGMLAARTDMERERRTRRQSYLAFWGVMGCVLLAAAVAAFVAGVAVRWALDLLT